MLKAILRFIDGKEFFKLTENDKKSLRDEDYKKVLGSYLVISNTFLMFGIIVIILTIKKIIDLPLDSTMFWLIVGITLFLVFVSALMFYQRESMSRGKKISLHFDILINFVILLFLTAMTLANIQRGGYLSLYVVGLITFGLLVRVRPHVVLGYFIVFGMIILLYINLLEIKLESPSSFFINIIAINIIIFITSRMLFIEHIKTFLQKKKIYNQNIELADLVIRDHLTNTYNKRGFANRILEEISYPAAICIFDLDGLKLINDAFGHDRGDEAIIFTADAIRTVFKDSFCARIGGDEFVVIAENIKETELKGLIKEFSGVMESSNKFEIIVSASVGYAVINENDNLKESFKKAENIMYHLKLGARSSRKMYAMKVLMSALYKSTAETEEHCYNVGYISQLILGEIGYARKDDMKAIKLAGKLHDIGKLSIPLEILAKEQELTKSEWSVVRLHSEDSYKIACGIIDNKEIADAILYHHEHWDGNGYPYGIKGDTIPLFARILNVADAYDSMVFKKDYRQKMTHEDACTELLRNKGTQFDPRIVDAFLKIDRTKLILH